MGTELRSIIRLPIACPICLKDTEQSIAWLVDNDVLSCRHCSAPIDLNFEETRALIKHFDDACLRFPGLSEENS